MRGKSMQRKPKLVPFYRSVFHIVCKMRRTVVKLKVPFLPSYLITSRPRCYANFYFAWCHGALPQSEISEPFCLASYNSIKTLSGHFQGKGWLETWKFHLDLFKALFLISLYIETNIDNLLVLKIQGLFNSALYPYRDFELKERGKMNWRNDLCVLYWQNTHCSDAVLFSITHNIEKSTKADWNIWENICLKNWNFACAACLKVELRVKCLHWDPPGTRKTAVSTWCHLNKSYKLSFQEFSRVSRSHKGDFICHYSQSVQLYLWREWQYKM